MPDHRQPKSSFKGRNGFTETLDARSESKQQLTAVQRQRFAQYVLHEKGTFFPSLESITKDAEDQEPEKPTLASIERHIEQIQEQHSDDLERLLDQQAREYHDDALHRYLSKDDSQVVDKTEKDVIAVDSHAAMERFYMDRRPILYETEWDDAVDRMRYAHLQRLLPLERQRAALEEQEKDLRRRRDAQFPQSIVEYRAIRNKDIQLRVARFLLSDRQKQETMMSEFVWAWRQVKPLSDEFDKDMEFKTEIQETVKEVEARDPRKLNSRPSN